MELRFYYDVVCPYAYLASTQVEALAARYGATVRWCPALLGGIYKAIDAPQQPTSVRSSPRVRLEAKDLIRRAEWLEVPLNVHPEHPRRSVNAMRLVLGAPEEDRARVSHALFEAYHVANLDIADRPTLDALATKLGLDPAVIDDPKVKQALFDATDEAIARGMFGVPTFVFGDEVIWGVDRLHFVEECLGNEFLDTEAPVGVPRGGTVRFFHDFASPFSYLASTQIERIARRHGATVEYVPILLGALFRDIGTPDVPMFAMNAPRQAYVTKDLSDWSRWWGVPFRFPSNFPIRTVQPLRAALVAPEVTQALYRAAWAEDRDIADPQVLRSVLDEAGVDGEAVLAETREQRIKDQLRANTDEARALGVCGVPSMLVGERLFWGQDRLDQVDAVLGGWMPTV